MLTVVSSGCYTERMRFFENPDNNSYYVVNGRGSLAGDIIIPSEYRGKPITKINDNAFNGWNEMTSITIPYNITEIGERAFEGCLSLKEIIVDAKNPKYSSFDGNLYNKTGTELIRYAMGKTEEVFLIPNCVRVIELFSFEKCRNLKYVIIAESVTDINTCAFYMCENLEMLIIPKNVERISASIILNCTNLKTIYCESKLQPEGWINNRSSRWNRDGVKVVWDARWIDFDSQGGSFTQPLAGCKGEDISEPVEPVKNDYVFDGWYQIDIDMNNNGKYEPYGGDTLFSERYNFTVIPDDSITLYAKWIQKN